jgi:hypothetical protein
VQLKRKVQVASLVVIANGMLALTALSPRVAQANPCTSSTTCGTAYNCANGLSLCQELAQPGCTATSFTCAYHADCSGVLAFNYQITCYFN